MVLGHCLASLLLALSIIETFPSCLQVRGKRINKPLVEKPVDAEDHNINIYYPDSVGGGCKTLFRKVGNQSSAFYPGRNELRSNGCYIYEEFLPTEGTDVKVHAAKQLKPAQNEMEAAQAILTPS